MLFLHIVVKVGLIEKVLFEQRFEGGEGVNMWVSGEEFSRENSQCKGPEDSA